MSGAVNVSYLGADDWSGGLVTGNGRQGAVCYGGPTSLRTTVSHERLFLPVHEPLPPPDTAAILPELRRLCLAGNFQAAADSVVDLAMAEDPRYGGLREADPFIGAATIALVLGPRPGAPHGWRREVDHGSGLVRHEWYDDLGPVRHELFVSRADDVVVLRWTGAALSGRMGLRPVDGAPPVPIAYRGTARAGPGGARLSLGATFAASWPGALAGYQVTGRLTVAGGRTQPDRAGAGVRIDRADTVTLVLRTTVDGAAAGLPRLGFDELLRRHRPRHRALIGRCRLSLAPGSTEPTERLLAGAGAGAETGAEAGAGAGAEAGAEAEARATPALVERLFDAGRYAIVCSSGELPPNLQGVWSATFTPAWRGGYTVDGNLAAALAAVAATGTPELLLPLFDLVERHRADFDDNGRRLYGVDGPLLPPHLTTHGRHNHFTRRWCLTFWTAGAAWLARLYHEYWRYTGDRAFLTGRALPFMRAAARFYEAFLVEHDGALVFVPSYSPENSPAGTPDGPQAAINATMDIAAVRGLFRDLGGHDGPHWLELAARLPRYRVDTDGALAEWCWPGLAGQHEHRHASHLYGLWYEPDPQLLDDPALRAAATVSVRRRLEFWRRDGDEMAFGLAQVGLAAAALGLADEADEALSRLAIRYWQPNLVSTHNRGELFNVDLCGAFPALVVAMLVQYRGGTVRLLPARPAGWSDGRIGGVRLRDGIRVDELAWSPAGIEVALSGSGRPHVVAGPGPPVAVTLPARLSFPATAT